MKSSKRSAPSSSSSSSWFSFTPGSLAQTTWADVKDTILTLCDVRHFATIVGIVHIILTLTNLNASWIAESDYRPDECSTLRPFVRWHAIGSAAVVAYAFAVSFSCSCRRGQKKEGKSLTDPLSSQFSEPLRTLDLALGLGGILIIILVLYSCVAATWMTRICNNCPALYRATVLDLIVDQLMFLAIFATTLVASWRQ